MKKNVTHYEFLQINSNAEPDTIHRVFRFLASRYHPDNPKTGDAARFMQLRQAYEVLSDPVRRTAYDMACLQQASQAEPLSSSIDFMDSMEGELNRRLGLLAVLYFLRRTNPQNPVASLAQLEDRMGFPRDYLDFTIWYLQKKGYITRADNSDLMLTVDGVDFVETHRGQVSALNKLLTDESESDDTELSEMERPSRTINLHASYPSAGDGGQFEHAVAGSLIPQ